MTGLILTLGSLMKSLGEYNWKNYVFIRSSGEFGAESPVFVCLEDAERYDSHTIRIDEMPGVDFDGFLQIADLQDIVENVKEQRDDAGVTEFVQAAVHYHKYDAFLEL